MPDLKLYVTGSKSGSVATRVFETKVPSMVVIILPEGVVQIGASDVPVTTIVKVLSATLVPSEHLITNFDSVLSRTGATIPLINPVFVILNPCGIFPDSRLNDSISVPEVSPVTSNCNEKLVPSVVLLNNPAFVTHAGDAINSPNLTIFIVF